MNELRRLINIVEAFGRKGVLPGAPTGNRELRYSHDPDVLRARRYRSAQEYADDNTSIAWLNTDPPHIKQRHDAEHARLANRWLQWQRQGYIPVSGTDTPDEP